MKMILSKSVLYFIGPNKKIPVFRVTRPYLNLLTSETYNFFRFSEKKYNFEPFERRNAFQNA